MAIYTKTALKKIKKVDLIELYLEQQQKLQETATIANEVIEEVEELRKQETKLLGMILTLREENRKLENQLEESNEERYQMSQIANANGWDIYPTDSEEEEEECKYDGDDWAWGNGFTTTNGEYRICMAGGGDHWEDYVIKKDGCFIHNKDGMKKVRTFISCPEGNSIKVLELSDPEYKLDEGESNMRDVVEECYPEVLEYEEEEEDLPDRCVSCDKTFDLQYSMNHADKETKQKYDEYFGSGEDGGDLCRDCMLRHE